MVYELGINVFVDARHAENMPAIINIEKNVSVYVLVIFPVALSTFDYLGLVYSQIFVYIYLVDFALPLRDTFATNTIELVQDIA